MNQQINLYQSSVYIKVSPFSARRLLLGVGIWLGVLLAGYGIAHWRLSSSAEQAAELDAKQQSVSQRLAELQQGRPLSAESERLARQVEQLRAEKAARLPLLALLANRSPDDFVGFSKHLQGLAREDLAGVWLRDIVVAGAGRSLVLEGSALRAELVPRYVQRLSRQAPFAGHEFAQLVMSRSEERDQAVDFVLRTSLEEEQ